MVFLGFWLITLWNSRKMPCRKPTHPRNCLGKYHGITVKLSVSSITVFGIWLPSSCMSSSFSLLSLPPPPSSIVGGDWRQPTSKTLHTPSPTKKVNPSVPTPPPTPSRFSASHFLTSRSRRPPPLPPFVRGGKNRCRELPGPWARRWPAEGRGGGRQGETTRRETEERGGERGGGGDCC